MNGWKLFILFVGVGVLAGAGVSNIRHFAASSTTLCGNSILEPGEQCERGIACPVGSGCSNCLCNNYASSSSSPLLCGNAKLDAGELCDKGFPCPEGYRCTTCKCLLDTFLFSPSSVTGNSSTVLSSSRSLSSASGLCGNGKIDAGEICEVNVGCPYGKKCEACACIFRRASSSLPSQKCGNGKMEGSEMCESFVPCPTGFECSTTCLCKRLPSPAVCGNGVLDSGEDCDSGYTCPTGTRCVSCKCLH
ncbi:MAG: hypothetical protein WCS85_05550 [Candidatus Peribacteraceae bacterium]